MKHSKSRSASEHDRQDIRVAQAQPDITNSYSAVTFTNTNSSSQQSNPIIISTTQHPSQISIIHEVRNPTLKAPDMTSPTDSFHSVVSNFHSENRDGKVNLAFTGSDADVNNQPQPHNQSQSPPQRVFIQSYWSWNWPWSSWNLREKLFLLVIVILSLCILSLTSVLSVVVQKNLQYRDMLFNKLGLKV